MPGFDFSNYARNADLHAKGVPLPKATSTGTTIVGCTYKGGVVIAADTRATSGPIVADKNCEKLHYISPNIWCAGAGTAADTEFTTAIVSSQLELHSLSTGRKPRVVTCMTLLKQHLYRYQGHIGAYLVVAGVDPTGTHLFTVHAHGSTDKLPYVTMGSGSLAAMSVFESKWQRDMTKEEAVALCTEAIESGIFNDLGSGSNVDVCVITDEKVSISDKLEVGGINTDDYLGHVNEKLQDPQPEGPEGVVIQVPDWNNCLSSREGDQEGRSQEVCYHCGCWKARCYWYGVGRCYGGGCLEVSYVGYMSEGIDGFG